MLQQTVQRYGRRSELALLSGTMLRQDFLVKDHKSAERYLQAFLKTRNKDAKKEEATAETGELVLGLENYYNAADKWLKDLQKEKFFNEGIPEQSPK